MSASLSSSSALTVSGRDGVLRCIKAQLQPLYAAQHLTKEEFIAASKAALQRCLELQLQEAQSGNRSTSEADSVPVGKINAVVAGVLSKIAPHAQKRGSEVRPNAEAQRWQSAQEFEQHIVTQARSDVDVRPLQQETPVEASHQQPQFRATTPRSRKSSVTIIDPASPTQHPAHPQPTTITGLESLPGARVVAHAPSPSASRSSAQGGIAAHPQHDAHHQQISDDTTTAASATATATAAAPNPGKTLRAHRAQLDQIRLRLQNRVRHNDPSNIAVDTRLDSPRTGPESIVATEERVADGGDASTVTASAIEVPAVAAASPFQPLASPRKSLSSPGRSTTPQGARASESGQRAQHQQHAQHGQPTGQLHNQQEFVSPYFRRAPGTPGQGPATHQGPRSPPIAFATSGLGLPGTPQRHERPNLATNHALSLAPPSGAHTSSAVQLGHAGKTHAGLSGVSATAAASVVRQQRPPIRGQTPVTNRTADAGLVGAHGGEHGAAAGAVTLPHSALFAQGPRSVGVQGPRVQQGVTGHQTPQNQTPNRRDDGFSYGPPAGASPDAITLDDLARGVNSSVVKLSTTLHHQQQQQQQQQHHHSLRRVEHPAGPPGPSSPPPRPGRSNNATPRRTTAPPSRVVVAGAVAAPPLFTSDRDLQQWQAAKDERSIHRSQTDAVDMWAVDDRDVAPNGNDRQNEHPVESSRGERTYEQSSQDESQLAQNNSHVARPAQTSAVPEDAGLFQAMSAAHTQRREQEHLHREHLGLPPSVDADGRSPIAAVRVIASDQGHQGHRALRPQGRSATTASAQHMSVPAQPRSHSATQLMEHEPRPVVVRHSERERQDGYPRRPPPSRKDDFMTASEFEERARSDGSTMHGQSNAEKDTLDQRSNSANLPAPATTVPQSPTMDSSLLEVEITEPSVLLKADRLCFAEEAARQRLEEKEDHAWQVGITLPLEWGMRAMTGGAQVLQQNERRKFATQQSNFEAQPEGQLRHSAAVSDSDNDEYHHVDYARAGATLDESSPHRGPTTATTSSHQELHDDAAATSAVAEAELYIHNAATTDDAATAFLTASEQRLRRDPHIDRGSSKFYEFSQAAMAQRKSEDVSNDPVMRVRRRIDRGEDVGVVEVAAAKITRLQSDGPKPSVARPGAPSPEFNDNDNGDSVDGMEEGYNDQRAQERGVEEGVSSRGYRGEVPDPVQPGHDYQRVEGTRTPRRIVVATSDTRDETDVPMPGQAARNTTTGGFTVTSPTSQRSVLAAALAHVNAANATPSKRALDPADRRSSRHNDSDRSPGQKESNAHAAAYDLNATYDDSDALPFPPKDHTRAIDKLTRRMNATATPGHARDREIGSDRAGEGGRHEQRHGQRSPIPGRPAARTAGLRTFHTPPRHAPAAAPVTAGAPVAPSSAASNKHNNNPTMVDFSAARQEEPKDASQVRRTRPSDDASSQKPAVVVDAVTSGADGDLEQKLAAQEHTIRALLRGMKEKDTLLRKMAEVEDVQATVQARKATEESWRRMRSPRRDIHHGPGARDAAISEARDDERGVRNKRWHDDVVTISPSQSPPQQRAPRSTDNSAKRDEEHELRAADTPTGRRRRDLFGLGDNSDAPPDDGSSTTDAASPLNATIALTDEHGGQSGARRAVRRPQEDSNGPIAVLTPRATRASRLRQERLVATPTRAKSPVVSFAASATAGARSPRTGDATSRPSMRPSPQSGRAPTPTTRQTYSSAESSAPTAGAQEPGRGGRTSSPASSSGRRIVKPPSRAAVVEHMRELLQPAYDSGSLPQAKFVAIVQKISKEFFDTAAGRRWSTASVEEDRAWREHLRCEVDAALSQRR